MKVEIFLMSHLDIKIDANKNTFGEENMSESELSESGANCYQGSVPCQHTVRQVQLHLCWKGFDQISLDFFQIGEMCNVRPQAEGHK